MFCEGEPNGPDEQLWKRILIGSRHPEASHFRIQIKSIGGKQAAKNFARGYGIAASNDNWRIIRDRDLDAKRDNTENVVIWDKGKTILTGATCLESYFLLPDLLDRFIHDHRHKFNLSRLPQSHEDVFQEILHQLRDYQAVRWALQEVREVVQQAAKDNALYRTAGQFDLPNRLTDEDGKLPANMEIQNCTLSAEKLIDSFRNTFHAVDHQVFKSSLEKFQAKFVGEDFWTASFRYWFHGKDVLKHWLNSSYSNVGYKQYCMWAAYNLDWQQYSDLVEIQRLCQTE